MATGLPVSNNLDEFLRSDTFKDARKALTLSLKKDIDATGIKLACWGDSMTNSEWIDVIQEKVEGITTYDGGVGGQTSTQIKNRMIADTGRYSWPTIIWAGRNNKNDAPQVLSDIAAMVAALNHPYYFILSICNGEGEGIGTTAYEEIEEINSQLASVYGDKYLDVRSWLVSKYDPDDAQDMLDHEEDIVPTSLREDTIHLNITGNQLMANEFLLPRLGQIISDYVLTQITFEPLLKSLISSLYGFSPNDGGSRMAYLTPFLFGTGIAGLKGSGDNQFLEVLGLGLIPSPSEEMPYTYLGQPFAAWEAMYCNYAYFKNINFSGLPTTPSPDPGWLWNDGGTLKIS